MFDKLAANKEKITQNLEASFVKNSFLNQQKAEQKSTVKKRFAASNDQFSSQSKHNVTMNKIVAKYIRNYNPREDVVDLMGSESLISSSSSSSDSSEERKKKKRKDEKAKNVAKKVKKVEKKAKKAVEK